MTENYLQPSIRQHFYNAMNPPRHFILTQARVSSATSFHTARKHSQGLESQYRLKAHRRELAIYRKDWAENGVNAGGGRNWALTHTRWYRMNGVWASIRKAEGRERG